MSAPISTVPPEEAPAGVRYLLPREAFFAPDWAAREQERLFERSWNLVGYLSDVAGGAVGVGYAGVLPVVVRQRGDGTLAGWADPAGRVAPGSDVDPAALGLRPVAVDTWAGLLFALPQAGAAPDLRTWLADFPTQPFIGGPWPWEELTEIHRVQWELDCNWKFYIENHIDCLHLWYLHSETLGNLDHSKLTYRASGPHWACDEPFKSDNTRVEELPDIPGVPELEKTVTRANLIWPNVCWTSSGRTLSTYQVIPTGPETCRLDLRVRGAIGGVMRPEAKASTERVLYTEDAFACEQMQRVVRSHRFEVGPLAQVHEQPIMGLHRSVLAAMR